VFCAEGNDVTLFDMSGMRLGKSENHPQPHAQTNSVDQVEATSWHEE
jgi:hypothetical protein